MESNSVSARTAKKSSNPNYCISLDWLEVCCYGSQIQAGEFYMNGHPYTIVDTQRETAIFTRLFEIKYHGLVVAEVKQVPRSSALRRNLSLVKLSNRCLYCEDWGNILGGLLNALKFRYHGITRLDICYDCNYFADGRAPKKFIRDFVMKPLEERGAIYLAGCSQFNAYGRKSISSNGSFNYIAFHSNSSQKRGYIYDKTLELKEKKDKPWIRDMWERNGLISNDKVHVWRAEISLRSGGTDLLNLQTGKLFKLHFNYMKNYEQIEKVFRFYAAKVFDFRTNQGQKNRRNFSRLELFSKDYIPTCVPKRMSVKADCGRAEKVCYNKLVALTSTYTDLAESVKSSMYCAMAFIKGLQTIKEERYMAEVTKHYLDHFGGTRFISTEEYAYMEACSQLQSKRLEDSPEYLYSKYVEYRTMLAEEDLY